MARKNYTAEQMINFEAGKFDCPRYSATLTIIKIGWNGNHCLIYRLTDKRLRIFTEATQHKRRKLLRRE